MGTAARRTNDTMRAFLARPYDKVNRPGIQARYRECLIIDSIGRVSASTRKALGFHIDYCFVPKQWMDRLDSVQVGSFDGWIASGFSDHAPLIIDVSPS